MHIVMICVVLGSFFISGSLGSTPQCFKCDGITSPGLCHPTETCGRDEICYTREITYEDGRKAYRMGCQDTNVCRFLQQPQPVIGRRAPGNNSPCFRCCQTSLCNKNICEDGSGQTTISSTSPISTTQPKSCPSGYVKGPDSCLSFVTTRMTWKKAWGYCRAMGAELVTLNSVDKSRFVASHIPTGTMEADSTAVYWTGGLYDDVHDVWLWRDGTIANVTMWAKGNPNASVGSPLCIMLLKPESWTKYPRGSWFSNFCSVEQTFICEIPFPV